MNRLWMDGWMFQEQWSQVECFESNTVRIETLWIPRENSFGSNTTLSFFELLGGLEPQMERVQNWMLSFSFHTSRNGDPTGFLKGFAVWYCRVKWSLFGAATT